MEFKDYIAEGMDENDCNKKSYPFMMKKTLVVKV